MDLQPLTDLPVLPLCIRARARESLCLPQRAGSTLRGAFGAALKRLVCVRPDLERCGFCPHRDDCVYPAFFEPRARADQAGTAGFEDLPRPYVIRPELEGQSVPPGGRMSWSVTLIGRAIEHLPYFVLAWRAMGEAGIGLRRGRFDLERVEALDLDGRPVETLYERRVNQVRLPTAVIQPEQQAAWLARHCPAEVSAVEVYFRSPTCLKHQGQPVSRPEFHLLWRALQRRLSLLRLAHGTGRPEVDFAATIRQAEAVQLAAWEARQEVWERYSRRQDRRVPMQGLIGRACYEGELSPFLPALLLGTLTGVGDNCTFGQGIYQIFFPMSPP